MNGSRGRGLGMGRGWIGIGPAVVLATGLGALTWGCTGILGSFEVLQTDPDAAVPADGGGTDGTAPREDGSVTPDGSTGFDATTDGTTPPTDARADGAADADPDAIGTVDGGDASTNDANATDSGADAEPAVDAGSCGAFGETCCVPGTTNLACERTLRCDGNTNTCTCPTARPDRCSSTAGDVCVDVKDDPENCGSCRKACKTGAGSTCQQGKCICQDAREECFGECCGVGFECSALRQACECSAPGYKTCSNACVDTQTDARNCGDCGIACESGSTCTNGQCGPVLLVAPVTAGNGATEVAVAGGRVFWLEARLPPSMASLNFARSAAIDGSGATSLYTQSLYPMRFLDAVVDGMMMPHVFFGLLSPNATTAFGINRDGSSSAIPNTYFDLKGLSFGGTNADLYFTTSNGNSGSVYRCPGGTCFGSGSNTVASMTPVTTNTRPGVIVAEPGLSNVFWADGNGTGSIRVCGALGCAGAGGVPGTAATDVGIVRSMVYATSRLYWTSDNGGLYRCENLTTPPCNKIAMVTGEPNISALYVDATHVYFATNNAAGEIKRCPIAGCPTGGPGVMARGQAAVMSIAGNGTHIFWGTAQGVMRRPKP
ncbi:MAG: hypothetical protein U0169_17030 [Polyangiaceae bacterium]